MDTGGGLAAGSHMRDELHVMRATSDEPNAKIRSADVKTCRVCGDEIAAREDGQPFVACSECGFPVCKPCYEYERGEGTQCCPQCNTRYKRQKGCPRVEGDEDEGPEMDDFEEEFQVKSPAKKPHEPVAFDVYSENGEQPAHKWRTGGQTLSSFTGSSPCWEGPGGGAGDGGEHGVERIRIDKWKTKQEKRGNKLNHDDNDEDDDKNEDEYMLLAEARQPLWRKVPIPSSKINPYRIVIVIRLVVLCFFLKFHVPGPASALRYDREGEACRLSPIDFFVSTVDPLKEPPIITANTVLSILAVDYPVDRVSCYVSDDGASMLLFDTLSETAEFARRWVPFCKKFAVEPRAPEFYFSQKIDYLKDKVQPTFVKERARAMKREYEEFKVRVNALVAKAQKKPEEGWVMQDGTPWPGNNTRDHPGMIQRPGYNHHKKAGAMNALVRVSAVLTNAPFILNLDCDHYVNNSKAVREAMCFLMDPQLGKKLCYVQFPQRFDGIDRHDRYANRNVVFFDINMKGLDGIQGPVYVGTGCVFNRQALYGYDPPRPNKRPKMTCDCWPSWCCCCCCFGGGKHGKGKKDKKGGGDHNEEPRRGLLGFYKKRRGSKKDRLGSVAGGMKKKRGFELEEIEEGLEGYDELERSSLMSQKSFEKRFGQSPVFHRVHARLRTADCRRARLLTPPRLSRRPSTSSAAEDILTGFKMHCRGWKSVYCTPSRPAFKGSAPINLSDRLHQVLRWALGSVEIFMSRHCPLWYAYGGRLKWLERFAYTNTIVYPFTSIPLPHLLHHPRRLPPHRQLNNLASIWFIALFLSIIATGVLELRWSGVSLEDWWRNEQFWVIGGVSAHLFAVFQGLLKVLGGVDTNFTVTSKAAADETDAFGELYLFKWTTLLVPPTTLIIINMVGIVAGVSDAVNNGYGSWGPLFGKLFFSFWVILHLYPFLKGLMGRQNRTPTIVVLWSILLASIFSLVWVRIDPFIPKSKGPVLKPCGVECWLIDGA
ncbi:hypothetical protein PR202_ga00468 [Eleusine coracana subsp. coracana]|uniref:Cellulose synthase n=1 Tax=Eleusine coracana subsp. coracana TaxID=191504 RepID=A0AAV5BD02_ELECO|nr:hypothetical protein PR202_ga00468 [Eleusine coracana subsp. coracana]